MSSWPMVPVGALMGLRSPDVEVSPNEQYQFAGVYCFGKGIFVGQKKSGMDFAYKRLTQLRTDDFVYPKLMAWEGALGVVPPECDGLYVSTEFPVFEIDRQLTEPRYLDYFFRRPSIWPELSGGSTGTNVRRRRLHPSDFLRFRLPLPSLEIQRSLVERIDALAAKVEEAKKLRTVADKKRSTVEAAFANAFFTNDHIDPLQRRTLGELAQIQSGVTLGRAISGPIVRKPYLRVANVQDGHFNLSKIKEVDIRPDEIEKWQLLAGDLLLTEGGDWDKLGRGSVWRGEIPDCIHQNHIFRVRVESTVLDPEFLAIMTASTYGKAYFQEASKQTTNLASINQRQLKAFLVFTPPIEQQKQIVNRVRALREKMQLLQNIQESVHEELEVMVPAILDRAFRGEL